MDYGAPMNGGMPQQQMMGMQQPQMRYQDYAVKNDNVGTIQDDTRGDTIPYPMKNSTVRMLKSYPAHYP